MTDLYGVRDNIERARAIIARADDREFAYAALEIRFCMEAIAYRQLDSYGAEIKSQLMKEWNPSRIVRMLASLDEDSDQSAEFSISVDLPDGRQLLGDEIAIGQELETGPDGRRYLPIGRANRIPWKKFREAYNSLGSFLHLGKDGSSLTPTRDKLLAIVGILDDVADSTIIAALNNCATGQCSCGTLLVLGPKQQAGDEVIYCTNRQCKAAFKADKANLGSMIPVERILLTCPCGSKVLFHKESMLAMERCEDCSNSVRALICQSLQVVPEAY